MKKSDKKNIVIGILCCMIIFMSIGYAVLSQTLKITGTASVAGSWKIYIDSITFNESQSSRTTSGTGHVDEAEATKATYAANLLKPQDVVVYDVVVANAGTIDAILDDIILTPEDNEYFKFETIGIEEVRELKSKTGDSITKKSFKIKITFKDTVTEENMPASGTKVEGLVKLDYVQKTGNGTGGEGGDIIKDAILLSTGDISKAKDNSITYSYYSDGSLKIKGSGQVIDFTSLSTINDYTLNNVIIRDIIYDDAPQKIKNILDGVNFDTDRKLTLNYLDFVFTGTYNFTGKLGVTSYEDLLNAISFDDATITANYIELLNLVHEKVPMVTSVQIDEGITNISSGMFLVYATQKIVLPSTVKTLDYWAMPLCGNIVLNEGLETIGRESLINYMGTTLTIPSTLTNIVGGIDGSDSLKTIIIKGDSTRFDANWEQLFGTATKVVG